MAHQNTHLTNSHVKFNQITISQLQHLNRFYIRRRKNSLFAHTALAVQLEHLNPLAPANRANATNPVPSPK